MRTRPFRISMLIVLFVLITATAGAQDVRLGVPSWPGVTVKSEVAAQLLEAMGYDTRQIVASPSIIFASLEGGSLNAYLGGWTPVENPMIDPLVEKGVIEKTVANVSDARTGLAVPSYAYEAGVRSMADLDAFADRFDSRIYGLEEGSGINEAIQAVIDENREGLGDWELIASNTASMLAQVDDFESRGEWFVFVGWRPHWMNIAYDFEYLSGTEGTETVAGHGSVVYTILRSEFAETNPNLRRFFRQFVVDSIIQSEWVLEHGQKNRRADEVAREWISANEDVVARWLDGVETSDGDPAIESIRAAYR